MKSWKTIPPEILELILAHINDDEKDLDCKQDLFECEIVCRPWRSTARRVVYAYITLTNEESTKKLIASATIIDQAGEDIGELVKTLDLDLSLSDEYCITYLPKFTKLFTSLEHLKARMPSDIFYQVLEQCDATWKYLKRIPEPYFETSIEHYGTLACKYQATLTTLLCDDSHSSLPPAPPANDSNSLVRRFPKLTHLKLKRFSNHPLESFDSIVEGCPSLNSFDFNIRPQRMVIITGEFNSQQDEVVIDLNKIVARPAIKRVRGLVVIYNDQTLIYLMQKYPQLHLLDINYRDAVDRKFRVIDSDGRCTFSPNIVAQFISYIQEIPTHNIQFQLPVNTLHQALSHYGTISSPSDLLHALSISYKAGSHLHYYIPAEVDDEPNAVIQISNTSSNANDNRSNLQISYSSSDALSVQPHLVLIEKFGAQLDQLSISISSEFIPGRPNISVLALCLDEVFKHCINLRHLTIYESTFVFSVIHNSYITNSSITDLVLTDITILNQDVLYNISRSLPSLKNLVVDHCKFESLSWTGALASERDEGHVDMKYTSFDTLSIKNTFAHSTGSLLSIDIVLIKDPSKPFYLNYLYDHKNRAQRADVKDMDEVDHSATKICIRCASIKKLKFDVGPFHGDLDLSK